MRVTATEMSVQEPGKSVQTTAVSDELFPEATYSIKNDTLKLTYQTHKAVRAGGAHYRQVPQNNDY
ncbi:hypothetical protein [Mucilaginibacter sp. SJ]|uniref:hypothetical protein n=1 Tax=Mucilaginibacter sp. SJ TaxID=3029053 RepID=UPI0023A9D0DE|nr:hypothetical protein [Mucilaginibacter sp. SJ]WEA00577.1 hypothetical protein MusilaSJ_24280 [Mucilaginibacter sp. SJ]